MSVENIELKEVSLSLLESFKERGYDYFVGVPDSFFRDLIQDLLKDSQVTYVPAVREDVAVGMACGAHLAGKRPLVFMENSGLGTSLDALTSLALVYEFPLLLLIAWAGYEGKDVHHHNVMGLAMEDMLKSTNISSVILPSDSVARRDALIECESIMEEAGGPVALLVKPGVLS